MKIYVIVGYDSFLGVSFIHEVCLTYPIAESRIPKLSAYRQKVESFKIEEHEVIE